jgi:hypothetical protein
MPANSNEMPDFQLCDEQVSQTLPLPKEILVTFIQGLFAHRISKAGIS